MTEEADKSTGTDPLELEPIEIAFSDGRRIRLAPDITQRIWEAVDAGHATSPEQYLLRAFGILDEQQKAPTGD